MTTSVPTSGIAPTTIKARPLAGRMGGAGLAVAVAQPAARSTASTAHRREGAVTEIVIARRIVGFGRSCLADVAREGGGDVARQGGGDVAREGGGLGARETSDGAPPPPAPYG